MSKLCLSWHIPQDKPSASISHYIICEDVCGNFYKDYIDTNFDEFGDEIIRWSYIFYDEENKTHDQVDDIRQALYTINNYICNDKSSDNVSKWSSVNPKEFDGLNKRGETINVRDGDNKDTSSGIWDRISSDLYDSLIRGTDEENSFKPKSVSNFIVKTQADAIERDFNKKDRYE